MASVFISSPAEVVVIDSRTRSGTMTLPTTNSIPFRVLNFKDQYGTFSNSTFTISTQVGESFDDGTTTKTFSNAFSYLSVYAVSSKWMVMNASQTVQQTISSLTVNQLTFGTGAGWVQFGPVQATAISSIQVNTNDAYVNNLYLGTQSTVNDLLFYGLQGNFNNTAIAELSTGAGTQELLLFKASSASDRVRVQTTGTFVVETGVSARLWPTVNSNVTPAFIINSSSNVGIQTATPQTALDVAGTGRFQSLSSLAFNVSTINGQVFGSFSGAANSLSAGTVTVSSLFALQLNVSTSATISSLVVNSLQIGDGTGWISLGPIQNSAVSTIQVNANTATTILTSTLALNISSINGQVYSGGGGGGGGPYPSPFQVGTNATESYLAFYGTSGAYTNTVVAEDAIGGGNQELILFRGSNASDRIRMQTTGSIIFEPGVSARLWPTAPSNVTPAMTITTNSNVGIQTASPGAALDVAGTGRFITLSSQQMFVSSINGAVPGTGGGGGGPFVEVSTVTLRTGALFASLFFI